MLCNLKYHCKQLWHQSKATDEIATAPHTLIGRMILNVMYTIADNLRDQASSIDKNKDVMDTEYVHFRSNNNLQVDAQTNYSNNCSETNNNSNCGSYEESQSTLEPLPITQQKCFLSI